MNYNEFRRKSRRIKIGNIFIGGDSPVSVQSMTNTETSDFKATLNQIKELTEAGCEIVRLAVPDENAVPTFAKLKEAGITIPLVADIHFDYRLAIKCAEGGADKIRINPGNIGDDNRVHEVVRACRKNNVPIRIGVNSGSLEKEILEKHMGPTAAALAESALRHVALLEKFDFNDIVIAIKSSDVPTMIEANRILAQKCDYPLHLGVTEAGTERRGIIKSSVGIGSLLTSGIGDTIRVSLTENPVSEVENGILILKASGVRNDFGIDIVSCPTCGRTKIDIINLVKEFEKRAKTEIPQNKKLNIAIMGCAVNGPGEAREADIGIAGGIGEGLLFKKGRIIKKVQEENIIDELINEINRM